MTDFHLHFGQFREKYYDPAQVMETVFQAGQTEVVFSSTTSCRIGVSYFEVEREVEMALKVCPTGQGFPLLWYTPDYIRQGLTAEMALGSLPYYGFKLHPRAHAWDFTDSKIRGALHGLLDLANQRNLPVWLHTGDDALDEANRFSQFFGLYPHVHFILAHARPLGQSLALMARFPNVYCDTSFMAEGQLKHLAEAGFLERALPGSDFPITHYFSNKAVSLAEQYITDMKKMTCSTMNWITFIEMARNSNITKNHLSPP